MKRSKIIDGIAINEQNRFSCFVRSDDASGMADLRQWVSWFAAGGIGSVIAETKRGWAVYRLGLHDDEDDW